eukprot:3912518-Rhodomonas_salina.1
MQTDSRERTASGRASATRSSDESERGDLDCERTRGGGGLEECCALCFGKERERKRRKKTRGTGREITGESKELEHGAVYP